MGAEGLAVLGQGLAGLLHGVLEGAGKRMQAERAEQRVQEAHSRNKLEAGLTKFLDENPDQWENPAVQAFFDDVAKPGKKKLDTGASYGESLVNFMRLKSTLKQGIESRKGTENLEANQQLAQEEVAPNTSRTVGKSSLPGGSTTKTGPPISFGQKIDALLWQRFKKRAADATPEESEWAKKQVFREELKQDIIKNGAIKEAELQQRISPEWFAMLGREQVQKILIEAQTEARPDVMGWRGQAAANKRLNELRTETSPEGQALKDIEDERQLGWQVKGDLQKRLNAFDAELTQLERDEKEYDKERELRWKMRGNLEEQRQQSSPEFIKLEEERAERAVVRALRMEALRNQLQESPEYQAQLDRLNELEAKRKARTAEILRPGEVETARQVKGVTIQEELDVSSTEDNLGKAGKITKQKEMSASEGRELGKLTQEVLARNAEQFARQEEAKRTEEKKRHLTVQEQIAYGRPANTTIGEVQQAGLQAMAEEDRAAMGFIESAQKMVSRLRYYSSVVNDFGPLGQIFSRSDAWLQDMAQTGKPEYRALANLTLETRTLLNAAGEFGKAIAVQDIEQTVAALGDPGLTKEYATFLLDKLETGMIEKQQALLGKYLPHSGESLQQKRETLEKRQEELKPARQKQFDRETTRYLYRGYEKQGAFTEKEWQRILKKNNLPFEKGRLLPNTPPEAGSKPAPAPLAAAPRQTAPAASPPVLGGITEETLLYRGGHPEMGGRTLEKWEQLSQESGFDMSKEHFYPTEKEAEENPEVLGKKKPPGPQSKRGWRKGNPTSARG